MFPLLPRIWLDLAAVRRARGERACEIEAITLALRITPGWSHASRQLSTALEADGHYDKARAVLERAIAHSPLDPHNHGHLAYALWHLGQGEQGHRTPPLYRWLQALEPDYDWAWDIWAWWAKKMGRPGAPVELARILAEGRSGDAKVCLRLALTLVDPADREERIKALDRSISLDPLQVRPHDLKAEVLAEAKRWDEAKAACRPSVYGAHPPISSYTAAWSGSKPDAVISPLPWPGCDPCLPKTPTISGAGRN